VNFLLFEEGTVPSELLAAAVGSTDDAVVTSDLDAVVTSWNHGAEQLFGYTADEAIGRSVAELVIPSGSLDSWQQRRRLTRAHGRHFRDVVRRRRKDGSEFAAAITLSPLHDESGRTNGIVMVARDFDYLRRLGDTAEQAGIERDLLVRAVDSSPLYVIAWDPDGVVVLATGRGGIGQQRSTEEPLGRSMFELYGDDPVIADAVTSALAGEELDFILDYNGRRHQVACRPLRGNDGSVVGGVGSSIDVTDMWATSEALRRSEAKLRAVLQHVSEVILLAESDGRMREAFIGSARVFGYVPEDVLGHIGWEFVHPADEGSLRAMWAALLAEPDRHQHRVAFRVRRHDGSWGWAEQSATNALDDPDIRAVVVNLREVTDVHRAEQALRESERRYREVVEASSDAIAVIDEDHRVSLANARFCELVGRQRDELLGLGYDDLGLPALTVAHPLEPTLCALGERVLWLRSATRTLSTGTGDPTRTLVVITDDTERLAVQRRAGEAERLEAIGRFASGVAHDFNNVLSTVRGHAELILESTAATLDRSDAEAIVRGVDRATALVDQLLAFARGQRLRPDRVDINDVVAQTLSLLTGTEHVDVRFARRTSAVASVDVEQMQRVLLNLLGNAVDADATRIDVDVDVDRATDRVTIVVSDNGSGMTSDQAARCFEPFYTTKGARGTGLGLATVYGIVRQSGGTIDLVTTPGGGSRFIIHLAEPAADAAG
jgi:two-component system, cell cycle sensor histidine kinase and response regulator CckA